MSASPLACAAEKLKRRRAAPNGGMLARSSPMSERIQRLLRDVYESVNEPERRSALGDRFAALGGSPLAAVQREIAEEIAHSLGKAGRKVQRQTELVRALVARVTSEQLSREEREQLRHEYQRQRLLAERHLRDLLIQREALGLRRHEEVRRVYVRPEWPDPSR